MNAGSLYDAVRDQYIEVEFDEFSESEGEEELTPTDTIRFLNPLLVLRRQKTRRKSRASFLNFVHLTRIVRKSGRLNTFLTQLPNKNLSYIRDLGNTLLTLRWRWILLTLYLVNFTCFVIFSWLWMLLAMVSGDFNEGTRAKGTCIVNAHTFTGYLLLSIETMTTIGYGYRYPTEHCTGGWVLLLFQTLLSVFVQGALVSVVYVKTSKPFTNISSSLFSKRAVICLRDGKLRFVFRIHDFSRKIWCGTNISLYFIDKESDHVDAEFEMQQMAIEPHGLLIFPLEIEHVIDEDSPLWKFRPLEILQARFEIVAVAEGSSTITGQVSQNRTSYSHSDIMWGHRFKQCVEYNDNKRAYIVDYKKFKQTVPFDTPLCSARKLAELQRRNLTDFGGELAKNRPEGGPLNSKQIWEAVKSKEERIPQVFYKLFHKESVNNFQDNVNY
ncbi:ATP-sensitive inward rectifier potassium channel 11-like isoform X2 [Cylas formicarius]|uniref:ATP-sensitive inward rectifier potassium channel 11-like isoform X2 n=1 Tax=Cylas formicarius TaxID=197179 RepID=UPI002958A792|nr:ATP-sensitive inward rectifier potassium channel 11-like isoform X2 [Cylas formicarius]